MQRRVAFLFGSSQYDDCKLSGLNGPRADVEGLAEILRAPALGSFAVEVLVNRTMAEVMRAVGRFFRSAERDDLVLFYFSGHGMLDESRQLFFACSDTQVELLAATAMPASFVNGEMKRCRASSQVLVLDCCHGGAFSGAKGALG